jgi:hypothetical protein
VEFFVNIDAIPVWVLFVGTILLVLVSIEAGHQLSRIARRRSECEKESAASAIAGSVLALLAFMLAFTFGIVAERYDTRKELVRDEANTIRTTWQRTDFLPDPDRGKARELLREYVNARLALARSIQLGTMSEDALTKARLDSETVQDRLWDMAVVNARKDMNSDVAALYIDSLNRMTEVHTSRVVVGLQQRIPAGIWIVLWGLTFFGMAAVGYQTGIVGSRRSLAQPILAVSFSMVIVLIALLDRPLTGYVKVSQQPLIDLYDLMTSGAEGGVQQITANTNAP